jgi:hypothetical protein
MKDIRRPKQLFDYWPYWKSKTWDYRTYTVMGPKQVIYWANLVTRRRRRRRTGRHLETTGRIQSWGLNRSFIGLSVQKKKEEENKNKKKKKKTWTTVRDYWTDTILRPKQVIYWPNFVTRRRTLIIMIIIKLLQVLLSVKDIIKNKVKFHISS